MIKSLLQTVVGLISKQAIQSPPKPIGPFGPGRPISRQKPPALPGHYRWIDRNGRVVYYGTTNNLARRYREHAPNFPGCTFVFKIAREGVSSADLYPPEVKKIKQHRPTRNGNGGGGGPHWSLTRQSKDQHP